MKKLSEINIKETLKNELGWDRDEDRLIACGTCIGEDDLEELIERLEFVVKKVYRQAIAELLEEAVGEYVAPSNDRERGYNQAKAEIRERIKQILE